MAENTLKEKLLARIAKGEEEQQRAEGLLELAERLNLNVAEAQRDVEKNRQRLREMRQVLEESTLPE